MGGGGGGGREVEKRATPDLPHGRSVSKVTSDSDSDSDSVCDSPTTALRVSDLSHPQITRILPPISVAPSSCLPSPLRCSPVVSAESARPVFLLPGLGQLFARDYLPQSRKGFVTSVTAGTLDFRTQCLKIAGPIEDSMGTRSNGSLVCVPLVVKTVEEMRAEMFRAKASGADLVEIRIDHLTNFRPHQDLQFLLKSRPLPALVTYRPKWEGGEYQGDETNRLDALRLAMELGADYVDVELQVACEFANSISGKKPEDFKLIVSSHNYQTTPSIEQLGDLVATIQASGADIVKIACTAQDITDVARMFHVIAHCQVPMIGLVMSERGLISRLLCAKFGGYLTFGIFDGGKESAPGQPTVSDLLDLYNIRNVGVDTKVFGIIGKPVGHSKGPVLHNAAFQSVGFDGVYMPFLVDDITSFLRVYSSPDFAGFSVTIPHKESALKCCDEVDPIAKSIGAVNTIIKRKSDGKLIGYNTDYIGAISAIEDGIRGSMMNNGSISPLAGKIFVVIGAGGAGKALAYGAKEKGAKVIIANRTYERARALADLVGGDALSLTELESFNSETGMVLANTTSMGMQPNFDETPLSKHALESYGVVFDAVYTPKVTRLLREAEECGATTVSGLEMFIRQALKQFELFTGLPAPEGIMRERITRT